MSPVLTGDRELSTGGEAREFWMLGDSSEELPEHVDRIELEFQRIKTSLHQQLVESLDLSRLGSIRRESLLRHVRELAREVCASEREILGRIDRERLLDELLAETFGLGPLDPLMRDPKVTDILVNDPYTVYVERRGRLELTNVIFADEDHLVRIIQRIVSHVGRRIDEVSPMVDARLPDGSRVNAVIPPLAIGGPKVSIRRFGTRPLQVDDLLQFNSITPEVLQFLAAAVEARLSVLISGGTGAGKTTLLNVLTHYIPDGERLVTIEDSAELILQHKHWVRMETRPPNTEGTGGVTQRDLVRNSLRMRPDRIVVGEVRGAEVYDMLQAMNTGHDGSLTTVHANSTRDALRRLEMMVALTHFDLPTRVVREYIASGIQLVIQVARLKGGVRRVTRVSEIRQVDDKGDYVLNDLFVFKQTSVNDEGVAVGEFRATGNLPDCLEAIQVAGLRLDEKSFEERVLSEA